MPERLDNLRANLKELEAELASGQKLDAQTKASLEDLAADIRRLIARNRPDDAPPASLLDQLQTQERAFEASHPTLTQSLARIIDALGQIGI